MINVLNKLLSSRKFSSVDFATLKTAMMVAALDGEVSAAELQSFREMALSCRGCTPDSFSKLWDKALRDAGYILIQSRILPVRELVDLFVREAEEDFIETISLEVSGTRENAFDFLEEMANADGDYSDIERQAIKTLNDRVAARRKDIVSSLYSRGVRD